jgi:hypothetical protein
MRAIIARGGRLSKAPVRWHHRPRAMTVPTRTIHCTDALPWLEAQPILQGCSLITSLPDVSEVAMPLPEWKRWFIAAAGRVFARVPDDGVAIFYQTDIKPSGVWIDKAHLVQRAADDAQVPLIFHKVVCRKPPGSITFGRPSYAHLLCFSRGLTLDYARSTADVIVDGGESTWSRGMGVESCRIACRYVRTSTPTRTVVDPFCGQGMVLAVANALGLDAVGVELNRKRAQRARNLSVTL